MSFIDLGALGEIMAALATVATLRCLPLQIRWTNKLAILSIEQNLNIRIYNRRFIMSRDDDFFNFLSLD